MVKQIDNAGLVLGVLGILLCLLTGIARLASEYYLLGFQTITLFNAGTTLMIAACVLKLQAISMSKI